MSDPVNLWPNLIYKSKFPSDLTKVAEHCLKLITKDSIHGLEKGGGSSTFNTATNLILTDECKELRDWLITESSDVWKKWEFAEDLPRKVHRSWVNLHPPGAWTAEHDHGQVHQTIVIYLKQPVLGGNLMFKDPMQYVFCNFPKINRNGWKTVEVEQNDVLFFPGFLHHMTEKNQSQEDRLVMTVTISVDIFG
jgi:hypothetical protein